MEIEKATIHQHKDAAHSKRVCLTRADTGDHLKDTLTGSNQADHLYGMAGADTLTGDKDADTLYGGAGTDTYTHANGDGNDVIIDTDGEGKIQHEGQTLTGGKQVNGTTNLWESTNKQTHYALYHNGDGTDTLNISNGERLFVKDWQNNQLGIQLEDGPPATATPITDESDLYFASTAEANINGGSGNDLHKQAGNDNEWRMAA